MKYNRLTNQTVYAIFYRRQFKLMRLFSIVMREYREIAGLADLANHSRQHWKYCLKKKNNVSDCRLVYVTLLMYTLRHF